MKILKIVTLLVALTYSANAAVFTAASCSLADVTTAYNLCSSSGDTVQLPIGSATWSGQLAVSGKSVTILGAPSYGSQITMSYSASQILNVTCSATNYVRVSGIDWTLGTGVNAEGAIQFVGANTGTREAGFRFDHNRMTFGSASGQRALGIMFIWGLVDNNEFYNTAGPTIQMIQIYGSSDPAGDAGNTPQSFAISFGDANAVYIETNTFTCSGTTQGDDCIDAYGGASYVLRYNTFTNCGHGHHGMDSGSRRGVVRFEWYNNTYVNNTSYNIRHGTIRSGTGPIFNNSYGGSHAWDTVTLQYFRAYQTTPAISFQICDGTTYYMPSSGAAPLVTSGGRGFDNTNNRTLGTNGAGFTNKVDGAGTLGYPGRDQPGYAPGMVQTPIYLWNNTGTNGNVAATWAGGVPADEALLANFIQINRDWYQGSAMPGYTAYTYPYPTGGGGTGGGSKTGGKLTVGGKAKVN